MDHVEQLCRAGGLVGLQIADHVPRERVRDLGALPLHRLDPVFAYMSNAGGGQILDFRDPHRLGDADERDCFKERLTREEIAGIAAMAFADEMFSWRSPSARPFRQRRGELTDDELIDLMHEEPRLIRRPILITGGKVFFGFDAAEYEKALGSLDS